MTARGAHNASLLLCACLFLVATVTVVVATAPLRPWAVVPSVANTNRYYLAWQSVDGVYEASFRDGNVLQGAIDVRALHTMGAASLRGVSALALYYYGPTRIALLYVALRDTNQILRFVLDENVRPAILRNQMVMVANIAHPESIAIDATGERICISSDADSGGPVARCYRAERQLSSDGLNTVDEWWYSAGYYRYGNAQATASTPLTLDAVAFDTRSSPLENAVGSLWIDRSDLTDRRVLTRFPLSSTVTDSSSLVYYGTPPSGGDNAAYIVMSTASSVYALLDDYDNSGLPLVMRVEWSADGVPLAHPAALTPLSLGTALNERMVMWLYAILDLQVQRVQLVVTGAQTLLFNRVDEAVELGVPVPSASATFTPSSSVLPSPSTSASVRPSPQPIPIELPSEGVGSHTYSSSSSSGGDTISTHESQPPSELLPSQVPEHTDVAETDHHRGGDHSKSLWALSSLTLLTCCVPCVLLLAFVAYRKRATIRYHANTMSQSFGRRRDGNNRKRSGGVSSDLFEDTDITYSTAATTTPLLSNVPVDASSRGKVLRPSAEPGGRLVAVVDATYSDAF